MGACESWAVAGSEGVLRQVFREGWLLGGRSVRALLLLSVACALSLECGDLKADDSASLIATIREVKPSVVAIGTYDLLRSPNALFYGSGFVAGEGNLVLTVAHVPQMMTAREPKGDLRVFAFGENGRPGRKAAVVAQDSRIDIAVLRVEGQELPALKLGASKAIEEGTRVAFAGYPYGALLGLYPTTNSGIVSNICPAAVPVGRISDLNPETFRALEKPFQVFQIDGTAHPGNSGGPLFLPGSGEVIGVIASALLKKDIHGESAPAGITFAVPIDIVKPMLQAASEGGPD